MELISNASSKFFQTRHSALLQTFCWSSSIRSPNGRLQVRKKPTLPCTKKSRKGSSCFLIRNFQSRQSFTLWIPVFTRRLHTVVAMITLIQERHNHNESCVTVEVTRKMQRVEIHLANEEPGLAFFSTNLPNFWNVGHEIGLMLGEKGPHKTEFAHDIVRIHSLMIYRGPTEHSIVGDTKDPMVCCFPFT